MPTGAVKFVATDTLGEPVLGDLTIRFDPTSQSVGGATSRVDFDLTGETELTVTNLSGTEVPGTRYAVRLETDHFKTYAFFQLVEGGKTTPATDSPIKLVVRPKQVRDITAPAFFELHASLRTFLDDAQMQIGPKKLQNEDEDLLGKTGEALYEALGPLRKACLLNLFTKARHISAAKCWALFRRPFVMRQDRFFCEVDATTVSVLTSEERFVSAPSQLHKPLAGYALVQSFKSKDPHANIQVTVMRHDTTGAFAADVDIDESSGFAHGLEVIKNRFNGRTNPYLIRELLLLSADEPGALDPGYRFVFADDE